MVPPWPWERQASSHTPQSELVNRTIRHRPRSDLCAASRHPSVGYCPKAFGLRFLPVSEDLSRTPPNPWTVRQIHPPVFQDETGDALATSNDSGGSSEMEFVAWSLTWMANLVDACTGVVVGLGIIAASARATRLGLRRGMDVEETMAQIRLSLGRWFALSLQLALAADILRSVVAPTWDEIGKLGAIAALRTI